MVCSFMKVFSMSIFFFQHHEEKKLAVGKQRCHILKLYSSKPFIKAIP